MSENLTEMVGEI